LIRVEHCTSSGNWNAIERSATLRSGSYVTTAAMKDLSPKQRAYSLCLDNPEKGECLCSCTVSSSSLKRPEEGTLTCRGYPQYQLNKNLPLTSCSCRCEGSGSSDEFGKFILGVLLMVGAIIGLRAAFGRSRS
jgi:hypothetical protein